MNKILQKISELKLLLLSNPSSVSVHSNFNEIILLIEKEISNANNDNERIVGLYNQIIDSWDQIHIEIVKKKNNKIKGLYLAWETIRIEFDNRAINNYNYYKGIVEKKLNNRWPLFRTGGLFSEEYILRYINEISPQEAVDYLKDLINYYEENIPKTITVKDNNGDYESERYSYDFVLSLCNLLEQKQEEALTYSTKQNEKAIPPETTIFKELKDNYGLVLDKNKFLAFLNAGGYIDFKCFKDGNKVPKYVKAYLVEKMSQYNFLKVPVAQVRINNEAWDSYEKNLKEHLSERHEKHNPEKIHDSFNDILLNLSIQ